MTSDIDILRSAQLLVKSHGADATNQAATRADELLAAGDFEGVATWRAIIRKIQGLQGEAMGDSCVEGMVLHDDNALRRRIGADIAAGFTEDNGVISSFPGAIAGGRCDQSATAGEPNLRRESVECISLSF